MKVTFCDINSGLVNAWTEEVLRSDSRIEVQLGSIFNVKDLDAVVSPANSFGFMDGGIDGVYTNRFGPIVQNRVQEAISYLPLRELLVGQALLIATDDDLIRYCISAPTMRVPMHIQDPIDVYLATKAATIKGHYNELDHIAFPGMGTGVGAVPYDVAARMMVKGVKDALDPPAFPKSLSEAVGDHRGSLESAIRGMLW